MSQLWSFLTDFWNNVVAVAQWLFDAVVGLLIDIVMLCIDGFLTTVYFLVSALDLGSLALDAAASWNLLDKNSVWVIHSLGIPEGLTLMLFAIGIRMLLNLIPAALTRI